MRRVGTPHEVEPIRSASGSTHQDSIEALTGNRCSSLTFESKGGAELRTRRLRNREAAPRRAATRPGGLTRQPTEVADGSGSHFSTSGPADLPALRVTRTAWDAEGRAIEFARDLHRGDRITFVSGSSARGNQGGSPG